jgi:hypothetical protein
VDEPSRRRPIRVKVEGMTYEPVIDSQSALADAWSHLMGPWGFGGYSVWMMLIVGDRPVPQLLEIKECEDAPDDQAVDGLAQVLRSLAESFPADLRVAFLCAREGADRVQPQDRAWASGLAAAAHRAGVGSEVAHLATQGAVRPIPADEIGLSRPA